MYSTSNVIKPFSAGSSTSRVKISFNSFFYTASKSVNGDVVRLLIIGQPNKVNVPTQQFLNLAAGIDIVHIGIEITLSIMAG